MGVSSSNNAMETEQPNTNKKYYIDTNSVCVARENMDITTLIKDSMSKHNSSCISSAQRLYNYMDCITIQPYVCLPYKQHKFNICYV